MDFCAGTGSTTIAALSLGRSVLAIESNERQFSTAAARVRRFCTTGLDISDDSRRKQVAALQAECLSTHTAGTWRGHAVTVDFSNLWRPVFNSLLAPTVSDSDAAR